MTTDALQVKLDRLNAKRVLYFRNTMPAFHLTSLALAAAFIAHCVSADAYEMPPIELNSTNYPAWRDSINLTVTTNKSGPNIQFTLVMEKPAIRGVYWMLNLNIYQGTNLVSEFRVADQLLIGPDIPNKLHITNHSNKTLQMFSLCLSPQFITNSIVQFTLNTRTRTMSQMEMGSQYSFWFVKLYDMFMQGSAPYRMPDAGTNTNKR
jgi:hypothetical protein